MNRYSCRLLDIRVSMATPSSELLKRCASECGFELAGIAPAVPLAEISWYREWIRRGFAGGMEYLKGRRADVRSDPRHLLSEVRSILCVGKLYNGPEPYSIGFSEPGHGWISRYAWGKDYHEVMGASLKRLAERLAREVESPFLWKVCVDTAPLLERAYARRAGLGWIGKNSCLINQQSGSWFFLGALLVSLEFPPDAPAPDRCGSCTRCIDACPTGAIVPAGTVEGPRYTVDSNRCISYLTIESREEFPAAIQPALGRHVFGCDICQEVCPWNRCAPVTGDPAFAAANFAPPLETLAALDEESFRRRFKGTAVRRAGYRGFARNVAAVKVNLGGG